MSNKHLTPIRHILREQGLRAPAIDLALIIDRIGLAARRIARELTSAALTGEFGYTGATNVQGEQVKKLDTWANDLMVELFDDGYPVCTLISEEMEQPVHFEANCHERAYAVLFDPIDGSSNTDVDGPMGTIFAVRRRVPRHGADPSDVLTAGAEQVMAGYVLYGPSTMLVYTAGAGVSAFSLDRSIGEFLLWRDHIVMPRRGSTYAVNEANYNTWHQGARNLVDRLSTHEHPEAHYSLRYAGAFAADFHRCLLEGGIYMYPSEVTAAGKSSGKLRMLYEAAPIAMVAEQAQGRASNGKSRILELVPARIHERTPLYIGSAEEVGLAESLGAEG